MRGAHRLHVWLWPGGGWALEGQTGADPEASMLVRVRAGIIQLGKQGREAVRWGSGVGTFREWGGDGFRWFA